jgi:hypothetical protein
MEDLKGTKSGPVCLLGSGPSAGDVFFHEIGMPCIGINQSWKKMETPWRVFIDPSNWMDLYRKTAPMPELAIFPFPAHNNPAQMRVGIREGHIFMGIHPKIPDLTACVIMHLPEGQTMYRYMGYQLNEGTYAPFSGLFALEFAHWVGYNPIYLVGFDCAGSHYFNPTFKITQFCLNNWGRLLAESAPLIRASGVEVFDCSPLSDHGGFPKINHEELYDRQK